MSEAFISLEKFVLNQDEMSLRRKYAMCPSLQRLSDIAKFPLMVWDVGLCRF